MRKRQARCLRCCHHPTTRLFQRQAGASRRWQRASEARLVPMSFPSPSDLGPPIAPAFYERPADEVARDLLGAHLVSRSLPGAPRVARIVEVEAYLGESDLACHAARGLTRRTRTLYGPPGRAYVYLVYGVHELFNAVCQPAGEPHAVLVRAVEPLWAGAAAGLGAGPGKLTRALGITREHDGAPLDGPPLTLHAGPKPAGTLVTPRVGVAYAGTWADAPLRFLDAGSQAVSRPPKDRVGGARR